MGAVHPKCSAENPSRALSFHYWQTETNATFLPFPSLPSPKLQGLHCSCIFGSVISPSADVTKDQEEVAIFGRVLESLRLVSAEPPKY